MHPPTPPVGTVFIAKRFLSERRRGPQCCQGGTRPIAMATPHTAATPRSAAPAGKTASGAKLTRCYLDVVTFDLSDSGAHSVAEPRLLWERVERLVPRSSRNSSNNSGGSGGSSSSSSSSNSSSQPGSHCGSGERFRARCESQPPSRSRWGKTRAPFHTHACFPFSLLQIGGLGPPAARECWEKTR